MALTPSWTYKLGYSQGIISALQRRTAATEAAHLITYLKATSTILDLGCGPGSITVGLAQIASKGCIVGVDISAVSLALAQKHADDVRAKVASQSGQLGNIRFEELDVLQGLPFEEGSFDVVYS
ncbi:hypothetical protein VMCG_05351 [Cytospora schulzeri]|uniref:Methyltransferase domain-containing protein n=1 Tax=Cytospora schulzeri TaxID=448051 RepID=A0A423WJS7_9PEZI|nr:hypothetical protein VMCG_05351 [Valsa malicola]